MVFRKEKVPGCYDMLPSSSCLSALKTWLHDQLPQINPHFILRVYYTSLNKYVKEYSHLGAGTPRFKPGWYMRRLRTCTGWVTCRSISSRALLGSVNSLSARTLLCSWSSINPHSAGTVLASWSSINPHSAGTVLCSCGSINPLGASALWFELWWKLSAGRLESGHVEIWLCV